MLLLDPNVCSRYLRGDRTLIRRFRVHRNELALSTISLGELLTWAYRRRTAAPIRLGIEALCGLCQIHPVDEAVADRFGELRAALLDAGHPTPELDLLISATALVHDLTIVTDNVKDFAHVPGLRFEQWPVA